MSTVARHLEEEELQAYVDDRLDPERRALVAAILKADPKTAGRIESYRRAQQELRDLLKAKVEEPIPRRLRISAIMAKLRAERQARFGMAAAVSLSIAVGSFFGWSLARVGDSNTGGLDSAARADVLKLDAISVHRFLASGPASDAFTNVGDARLRQWLLRRLGASFDIPNLSGFGLRFMGGRILSYHQDSAIALLSYGEDQKVKVTVYLKSGDYGDTELQAGRFDDAAFSFWLDHRCAYVIVAMAGFDRLPEVAKAIFDHFEAPHGSGRTF